MNLDTTIKIAIADDHELFRIGIVKILQEYKDFDVIIEAPHGEALLQEIEKYRQLPDVILLDIRMPVMDGFDATEKILAYQAEHAEER